MALNWLVFLILTLWVSIGSAAVTFDAASSVNLPVIAETSFSHTASGSDRLAILCVGFQGDPGTTVDTHDYGGVPMTLVGSVGDLYMYHLIGPPTGPQLVEIVWNQFIANGVAGVVTFTGVDQTTPLSPFASDTQDTTGPATVSVNSASGEVVIDCVYASDVMTITVGGGQTARWEEDPGDDVPGGSSTKPGAAPTVAMSWTLSQQTNWRIGAASIKPTVAVSGGGSVRRRVP